MQNFIQFQRCTIESDSDNFRLYGVLCEQFLESWGHDNYRFCWNIIDPSWCNLKLESAPQPFSVRHRSAHNAWLDNHHHHQGHCSDTKITSPNYVGNKDIGVLFHVPLTVYTPRQENVQLVADFIQKIWSVHPKQVIGFHNFTRMVVYRVLL